MIYTLQRQKIDQNEFLLLQNTVSSVTASGHKHTIDTAYMYDRIILNLWSHSNTVKGNKK